MERNLEHYKVKAWVDWCPGCGNFGILGSVHQAFQKLNMDPTKTVIVSGIGCSGKTPQFVNVNGIYTLHGRAIPFATGIKLANPELTVIVHGGDGDLLGIGTGHFVALGRRNLNILVILHDNKVYGLTKGQASPTLPRDIQTKAMSESNIHDSVNPIALALTSGFTFIARGYSFNQQHLSELIASGINHKGAAFIDALQICVTYNDIHTASYYNKRLYNLDDQDDWDPVVKSDAPEEVHNKIMQAQRKSMEWGEQIPYSIFYHNPLTSTFKDRLEKQLPIYRSIAPCKQRISVNGKSLFTEQSFKDLFKAKIVRVKDRVSN